MNFTNIINPNETIESFNLTDESTFEVVYRQPSNMVYPTNPPQSAPDKVWKEVYGVVDGKITLLETIQGQHTPASVVEETITFNTKEKW